VEVLASASRVVFIILGIAVVGWATITMLLPRLTNPPVAHVLINESVYLTTETYEKQFSLELMKGERINIEVSGNGKIFDLWFAKGNENQSQTLVEQLDIPLYNSPLTIPADGTYLLRLGTYVGDVRVTVLVTKL
jgi:hypothetical protein